MKLLQKSWHKIPKLFRQIAVMIIGGIVIIAGIIMLAIPGPGWLTIFLGLAIISTEFIWAKRLRDWIIGKFKSAYKAARYSAKKSRK